MKVIETEIFLIKSGLSDEYYFAEYDPEYESVFISVTKSSRFYSDYTDELNRIEETVCVDAISMNVFNERLKARKDVICLQLKKCIWLNVK